MLRVVLGGEELSGFTSLGFDDHVKLFFPEDADGGRQAAMRDFTPRRYDADAGELWIDFFLHEAGPAAGWAAQAACGQTLTVGGPKGSSVISLAGVESHLLMGDETALPAIGRRLEELPAQTRALVVIEVAQEARDYPLASNAPLQVIEAKRSSPADSAGSGILAALRSLNLPAAPCFAWVAGESHAARSIRRHLMAECGLDKRWIKAAGYWRRGAVGTHENITDED
jgi:NADPH-dependent ferric siderophore reductase